MGSKSTNTVSTKQQSMLPLFQVISDLEKPYRSPNTSLQTLNSTSHLGNTSRISETCDIVLHHYSQTENASSGDCEFVGHFVQSDVGHFEDAYRRDLETRSHSKRSKKRRRLKMDHGNLTKSRYRSSKSQHSHKETSHKSQKQHSSKNNQATTKKKTGLFTSMSLDMFPNDEVDLSRHFKDLTEEDFDSTAHSDCPTYEVPRDIVEQEDGSKRRQRRRRERQQLGKSFDVLPLDVESDNLEVPARKCEKMSSKNIIKRYEEMLATLLEKNQQKDLIIKKKDGHIQKMKSKMKALLQYNAEFADENDYLKKRHEDAALCIENLKSYAARLEESAKVSATSAVPSKVRGCGDCGAHEAAALRCEQANVRLAEDLIMLKNVVYRLNVQLSRYQEKLRSANFTNKNALNKQKGDASPDKENEGLSIPHIPVFSNSTISETKDSQCEVNNQKNGEKEDMVKETRNCNKVEDRMVWGDVNTHTLAPLLNAYQESITEKDDLIRDYEREFNRFASKLKFILEENDALHLRTARMTAELSAVKEALGLAVKERDDLRRDAQGCKTKAADLEVKLKEVHECYEQKVETMSRDYNLIHTEYLKSRSGLAAARGRCQLLEEQQQQAGSTVPSQLHASRIQQCKSLFEELKSRYELDKSKMSARISVLQETNTAAEKRLLDITNERHDVDMKLKNKDRIIRRCRRDLASLRAELTATRTARDAASRRAGRATALCRQLAAALEKTTQDRQQGKARAEKISVQREALRELDEVEVRMKEQKQSLERLQAEREDMQELLRQREITIQAMRGHISGDRLQRFKDYKLPSAQDDAIKALSQPNLSSIIQDPAVRPQGSSSKPDLTRDTMSAPKDRSKIRTVPRRPAEMKS